jgi:membrane fusion protein, multidrug efflux system
MMIKKLLNKNFIIGIIILIMVICGATGYYVYAKYYPSTKDAYIKAYIVDIAPEIAGRVNGVYVKTNDWVKKGTLLFSIDPSPFELEVERCKATLSWTEQKVHLAEQEIKVSKTLVKQAKAKFTFAEQTYKRMTKLNKYKIVTDQNEDKFVREFKIASSKMNSALLELHEDEQRYKIAKAAVLESQAKLNQAQLNLSYTKIYTSANGYVSDCYLAAGEYVDIGQKVFAFIDTDIWWVQANFKETDLGRIRPGQKAEVTIDIYEKTISGTVMSVSFGSGVTYSLLPPENATGNWVKVVQRFPVRILIKDDSEKHPLRVGASTKVRIDTTTKLP